MMMAIFKVRWGGVTRQVAQLTDGQHLETEVLQSLLGALARLRSVPSGEVFSSLLHLPKKKLVRNPTFPVPCG